MATGAFHKAMGIRLKLMKRVASKNKSIATVLEDSQKVLTMDAITPLSGY
jgi:hypothetical protein